jgi:glycosyltransferase involved in cell wall biosynthesis
MISRYRPRLAEPSLPSVQPHRPLTTTTFTIARDATFVENVHDGKRQTTVAHSISYAPQTSANWITDMQPPRLISIVIPTFNALPLIEHQLTSLARQDYSGRFEVIIADNDPAAHLKSYVASHYLRHKLCLRWVNASAKKGAPYARNAGAAAGRGEFIAFIDQDDEVMPNWLTELATASTKYDVVAGEIEIESLNTERIREWRPVRPIGNSFENPKFLPAFMSCNCGIWRVPFEEVGGYDEDFKPAGEDYDLAWRLQLHGYSIGHAMNALVSYRLRNSYKETWSQIRDYGDADSRLYRRYRDQGLPPLGLTAFLNLIGVAIFRGPWLPKRLTRTPIGLWVVQFAYLTGRIKGATRHLWASGNIA